MSIIILFLSQFLTCPPLLAQEFSIGPKIGISQGDISVNGSSYSSGNDKIGYHAGLFARLGGNHIFIQPEVLYTNTGGEFTSTQGNNTVSYTAQFDKIDVPIMAGFKIAEVFRLQAGPTLAFIIDSDLSSSSALAIEPDYKKTTIAYQAGIGFDIANLIVDLKYEGALGKLADSYAGLPTDQRQNQLILSLGIRLF
ncbi:porin family protein [uncultured Cyclobacterium sp.]|uniref:porin family protein n=1 Tax=uncultured Cyclobacterium sp. TaxID=453820 RepID=UPI0030EF25D6|tara:strand:+ start:238508 stop:239095 length:588 start_codon:yes stop_codon:yes gene_type:complete